MVIDLRPVLIWLRWTALWAKCAAGTEALIYLCFGDAAFTSDVYRPPAFPPMSDLGGWLSCLVWHAAGIPEVVLLYLWGRLIPVGVIEGLLVLVCLRLRRRRLMLLALFFPLLWEIRDDFGNDWQASRYFYSYVFVLAPNWSEGLRLALPTVLGYLLPAVVSGVVVYWLGIRSLRIDGPVETASLENPSGRLPDPPVA
jgi:hypothetical protein